jgi:hypothetical protein
MSDSEDAGINLWESFEMTEEMPAIYHLNARKEWVRSNGT